MFIKCNVCDGFIESEKFIEITTVGGVEQVAVSGLLIENDALRVSHVGSKDGQLLVELPVESASGEWRVWIYEDQVREEHKVRS